MGELWKTGWTDRDAVFVNIGRINSPPRGVTIRRCVLLPNYYGHLFILPYCCLRDCRGFLSAERAAFSRRDKTVSRRLAVWRSRRNAACHSRYRLYLSSSLIGQPYYPRSMTAGVGRAFSRVSLSVCLSALVELSTPNLEHVYPSSRSACTARGQKVTWLRKPSRRTVASDYSRYPATVFCATCGRCRRVSACRYDCLCFLVCIVLWLAYIEIFTCTLLHALRRLSLFDLTLVFWQCCLGVRMTVSWSIRLQSIHFDYSKQRQYFSPGMHTLDR